MSPILPPSSPVSDNCSVTSLLLDGSDSEQPIIPREAPTSLAARFRNLGRTSPPLSPPPQTRPGFRRPVPPLGSALPRPPRPADTRPEGYLSYRPVVPRPQITNPIPRKVRASQVRSCDQCRTSKQKCDRNLPCATCSMRRIQCTWTQAGVLPTESPDLSAVAASAQVAANRAEIKRLQKEANTLARLLRLTRGEFELFQLEATRQLNDARNRSQLEASRQLREGRNRSHGQQNTTNHPKRSRTLGQDIYAVDRLHKSPRLHENISSARDSRSTASFRSAARSNTAYRPMWVDARIVSRQSSNHVSPRWKPSPKLEPKIPPVRPNSSSSRLTKSASTSPALVNAVSQPVKLPTIQALGPPRPGPVFRSSFSDLPPLKIPSLTDASRSLSSLPLRSTHPHHPKSSSTLTPASSDTVLTPRRRPQYVLPTPVYSATPTSASFPPLSNFSSPLTTSGSSKAMLSPKRWSIMPRYEASPSTRVQPYTPLSAVRDDIEGSNGIPTTTKETKVTRATEVDELQVVKLAEPCIVAADNDVPGTVKFDRTGGGGGGESKKPVPSSSSVSASLRNLLNS